MAIALDSVSSVGAGASPRTLSHTCSTGDDRLLLVCTFTAATTDTVTGVTYNGVAMTKITSVAPDAGGNYYYLSLWYLVAPATGANDIVATSSSGNIGINAISYTGCSQTGVPDAQDTIPAGEASPLTGTLTVVADNSWMALFVSNNGGNPAASTGSTERVSGTPGGCGSFDSNGALSAGSNSLSVTYSGSEGNGIVASFAPAAAVSAFIPKVAIF